MDGKRRESPMRGDESLAAARGSETSVASHGTAVRPSHAADSVRSPLLVWLVGRSLGGASFGCKRCMTPGLPSLGHVLSTKVQLGCEGVVGATMQRQVRGGVRALLAERLSMVELEIASFSTALTAPVDERAARTIAVVHRSPYDRGNVTAALASI